MRFTTKKIAGIVIASVLLGLLLAGGQFYWAQLRGAGPALKPVPDDIAELIDEAEKTGPPGPQNTTEFPLTLPDNFSISVFARDLGGPRVMIRGLSGDLLVSIPSRGEVVSLRNTNDDPAADQYTTIARNLRKPHGLALYCPPDTVEPSTDVCRLYIAEEHQVMSYKLHPATGATVRDKKIIDLPAGGRHTSRTLLFLDERLLISIGSSCDVCQESNPWRGSIIAVDPDGSNPEIFASGLRNAVFMARHPVDGSVWATEMGRDHLGDNLPPDEINIIKKGTSYGWPLCYGKNIHDAEYDKNTYIRNPCMSPFETPAKIDIPAHSAPLGIAFFPEEGWPEEYWYNALVAYHGSWNRTEPTGYKIVRIPLDASGMPLKGATRLTSRPVSPEDDFITGWLTDEGALGRPVDILIEPGGTMFVSDDKAEVIYRISYDQH